MLFEMSYLLHSISLNEVKIRSNKFVSYLSNEVQKERKQEKKLYKHVNVCTESAPLHMWGCIAISVGHVPGCIHIVPPRY